MSETENQSTEAVETSTSDSAPMTSTPPADGSAANLIEQAFSILICSSIRL